MTGIEGLRPQPFFAPDVASGGMPHSENPQTTEILRKPFSELNIFVTARKCENCQTDICW